ncbi:UDP-glucose dehydrogenase family protein [Aureimonas sp. D3]|uniref:UDP-glucose dehydrogenase family protein n=1 Tax=Aureimonas sp. D3 TaxID=1638164 RepID=UPI0007803434|nr:UDP-glucose/GDP-mannose dehydrogenase family protein [Aureimonas sp. D3]
MRIVVIGTGYVGLVTGACLAELGHDITCYDTDAGKIARLQRGEMPIFEPGLEELVKAEVAAGRLSFASGALPLDRRVRAVFVAVGTPPSAIDHSADLSAVHAVAEAIGRAAVRPLAVIVKSTVPVGTGEAVERILRDVRPGIAFDVVSNPEFLREGSALADFRAPDRIVVGTSAKPARRLLADIYRPLTERGAPLVFTERASAEMIKYAANAFLAAKIAFINEIADLCEVADADVEEVSLGMGLDRRIGAAFLRPGPGYGGSCFPKDTEALLAAAQGHGVQLRLVESTVAANEGRKRAMGRRVIRALGEARGRTIAVLGVTFKAGTDDMRQAPSLPILAALRAAGARLRIFDPEGMAHARSILPEAEYMGSAYECLDGADAALLLTDWPEFAALDLARVKASMRGDVFVDLRNMLSPERLRAVGLRAFGIGRRERLAMPAPLPAPLPPVPAVRPSEAMPALSPADLPPLELVAAAKAAKTGLNGHAT